VLVTSGEHYGAVLNLDFDYIRYLDALRIDSLNLTRTWAGAYREMLAAIRQTVPGAAVTSDFIVGFPGETEEDFHATVEVVRASRFKNSFIFKYSPRPGTKAALLADDVPDQVKRRRNHELLALQNAISLEDNRPLVGRRLEILVEGPSKGAKKRESRGEGSGIKGEGRGLGAGEGETGRGAERRADGEMRNTEHGAGWAERTEARHGPPAEAVQLVGRTVDDRIVVFDGPAELAGHILDVVIERADAFTLFGRRA
jgi:tRNA-2-methylthio-N6-dimethylallyladenosine synthase